MRGALVSIAIVATAGLVASTAQSEPPNLASIFSKPIEIGREAALTEVPLSLRNGKLYLQAKINSYEGEFVFDTGSPTILDKSLADQLELEIIGENTGRDANGKAVSMKIAMVDSISIGGVVFQHVPVMVHDYETVPLGKCYLPNGILGSELLPGSAWQIDTSNATLKIAAAVEELPESKSMQSAPLFVYGYPYAPFIDYSIGRFSDKALFDTGNSAEIALFAEIEKDKQARKQIDQSSIRIGSGRHGTSAGGQGSILPLKQFDLKTITVGNSELGRTTAQSRPIPPTLVGAGVLRTSIVTLDYPNRRFLMSPVEQLSGPRAKASFALMVIDGQVEVSQLFESSKAHEAGLQLGDKVVAIDGRQISTATESERCETSLWLSNEFNPEEVGLLTVLRDNQSLEIAL